MSSWDYTCKFCGSDFFTSHPDETSICYGCWSTKFTEAERQRILPGATPVPFHHMTVKERGLRALREVNNRRRVDDISDINAILNPRLDQVKRRLLARIFSSFLVLWQKYEN